MGMTLLTVPIQHKKDSGSWDVKLDHWVRDSRLSKDRNSFIFKGHVFTDCLILQEKAEQSSETLRPSHPKTQHHVPHQKADC